MKLPKVLLGLMLGAGSLHAQNSESDVAAFFGLLYTPVGALPMMQLSPGGTTSRLSTVSMRFASWRFDDTDDRNNTFAATADVPVSPKLNLGLTLAWHQPGGNSDGTVMGGMDLQTPMWESLGTTDNPTSIHIFARGSIGLGHFTGTSGDNVYSLVGAVPVQVRHGLANKSDLSFFISPAIGVAGISNDFGGDSGFRPLISLGGAWTSAGGLGIHAGTQQIILDGGPPWVWGISVSFPLGDR